MTRIVLALVLLITGSVVHAAPVLVRSGEHEGFTRLVVDIPSDTTWRLDEADGSRNRKLVLDRPLEFDLGEVFARITRDRIVDLATGDPGELTISLGCDCDIAPFVLRNRMLVLDVKPAETNANDRLANLRKFAQVRPRESPIGEIPLALGTTNAANGVSEALSETASLEGPGFATSLPTDLAVKVANAATQGLLEPTQSILPNPFATSQTAPSDPPPLQSGPGVEIQFRRSIGNSNGTIRIGATSCVPKEDIDLSAWGNGDDPLSELAKLRRDLAGEVSGLNRDKGEALARAYLFAGFGAEAKSVLLATQITAPELVALSDIIDDSDAPRNFFSGQENCDGPAAMWSVLSSDGQVSAVDMQDLAILRSFESLPDHLKRLLGPRLAENLTVLGETDLAADVLNRLLRGSENPDQNARLATARLDAATGAIDDARQMLATLKESAGSANVEALSTAIDLANRTGKPTDRDDMDLAAAYAVELRYQSEGRKIWQARFDALLATGQFDDAYAELSGPVGIAKADLDAARRSYLDTLVKEGSDTDFLKRILPGLPGEFSTDDDDLRRIAAARFLKLGMPDDALDWLATFTGQDPEKEIVLLRAEAMLQLSQPENAEIALIGMQGDEAALLRARARLMMGDYEYAQQVFSTLGDQPAARRAAWLSGNWGDVAAADSDSLAGAAEMVVFDPPAIAEPNLALAEDLMTRSQNSRETIGALLADTRLDVGQ